jgi:hypothetical protein
LARIIVPADADVSTLRRLLQCQASPIPSTWERVMKTGWRSWRRVAWSAQRFAG